MSAYPLGELLTQLTICSLCIMSICNILGVSHFGLSAVLWF